MIRVRNISTVILKVLFRRYHYLREIEHNFRSKLWHCFVNIQPSVHAVDLPGMIVRISVWPADASDMSSAIMSEINQHLTHDQHEP